MKNILRIGRLYVRSFLRFLSMHGIAFRRFFSALYFLPRYIKELRQYKSLLSTNDFKISYKNLFPVLMDYSDSAGTIGGHYTYQDLWAAKKIYTVNPKRHIDIGSRIDGFITHLLVFREVEVIDIRPLESPYKTLKFVQDDATLLKTFEDNEIESLSCLHAVEHFGLGRYGDPIDPYAHEKLFKSFAKKIKKDGILYLGTPVGKERLEFNAHRVFNPLTIIKLLPDFELLEFSVVNDQDVLVENVKPEDYVEANYSCGLYVMRRK